MNKHVLMVDFFSRNKSPVMSLTKNMKTFFASACACMHACVYFYSSFQEPHIMRLHLDSLNYCQMMNADNAAQKQHNGLILENKVC